MNAGGLTAFPRRSDDGLTVELSHATVLLTERGAGDLGRTRIDPAPSAAVLANRAALLERQGLGGIVAPCQVHGVEVAAVGEAHGYEVAALEADGQVTSVPGIGLAIHVADCLPVAIAGRGGVAMLHCGWKGLAGEIIPAGVAALRELGAKGPLEAVIGPGAGGCCYEVGPKLHARFARYGASSGRMLDLRAIAMAQLREAGVSRIIGLEACTLCAPPGRFFSHRRDGPATGRQAGIAWLR
jgi:hypothetical protein